MSSETRVAVFPASPEAASLLDNLGATTLPGILRAGRTKGWQLSIYSYVTTPEVLKFLDFSKGSRLLLRAGEGMLSGLHAELSATKRLKDSVRVVDRDDVGVEHAKIYWMRGAAEGDLVIVGSSNATGAGLNVNFETNVALLLAHGEPNHAADPRRMFETLWEIARPFSEELDAPTQEWRDPLDFQADAIKAVGELYTKVYQPAARGLEVPGAIVSLPTGAGKTFVGVRWLLEYVLTQPSKRVLWLCHRENLLKQAQETYFREEAAHNKSARRVLMLGDDIDADERWSLANHHHVVFATRQLLANSLEKGRRKSDAIKPFDVIVIDEAHHVSKATSDYPKILETIPHRFRLGLTATPWRTNWAEWEGTFDYFNPSPGTKTIELLPWFYKDLETLYDAKHKGARVFADPSIEPIDTGFDIGEVKNEQELQSRPFHQYLARNERIVSGYDKDKHRPALFFATSIEHANVLTQALIKHGVKAQAIHTGTEVAGCIHKETDGPMSPRRRRDMVKSLQDENDDLEVIVSVDVFIEGLDAPKVKSVFLARPTLSSRVYLQMVGRGLRGPAVGGTHRCIIVDCVDKDHAGALRNWDRVMGDEETRRPDQNEDAMSLRFRWPMEQEEVRVERSIGRVVSVDWTTRAVELAMPNMSGNQRFPFAAIHPVNTQRTDYRDPRQLILNALAAKEATGHAAIQAATKLSPSEVIHHTKVMSEQRDADGRTKLVHVTTDKGTGYLRRDHLAEYVWKKLKALRKPTTADELTRKVGIFQSDWESVRNELRWAGKLKTTEDGSHYSCVGKQFDVSAPELAPTLSIKGNGKMDLLTNLIPSVPVRICAYTADWLKYPEGFELSDRITWSTSPVTKPGHVQVFAVSTTITNAPELKGDARVDAIHSIWKAMGHPYDVGGGQWSTQCDFQRAVRLKTPVSKQVLLDYGYPLGRQRWPQSPNGQMANGAHLNMLAQALISQNPDQTDEIVKALGLVPVKSKQ